MNKNQIIILKNDAVGDLTHSLTAIESIINSHPNQIIIIYLSERSKKFSFLIRGNNIKFKFNYYFPIRTLNLMRGVLVAEEDNIKSYYIDRIFNTIWQDGLNMNDEIIIEKVLKNLNVNPKTFVLRSASSLIKDSLRKKTSDAYQRGVFGAPTFVVNNKIFWGQDRIDFALKEASK